MKLIREYINEKFIEDDSDPIHDLGIGIDAAYENWFEEFKSKHDWYWKSINTWLRAAAYDGKTQFIDYILKKGADINNDTSASLRYAATQGHLDTCMFLIKRGADIKLAMSTLDKHSNAFKNLLKIKNLLKKEELKESLNEKFFDNESDPIYDMGIGIRRLIEKWMKTYDVEEYTINDDLTIDVIGFSLYKHYLNAIEEFPYFIQFNEAFDNFNLTECNFKTLRGCPKIVHGKFWVGHNNLTTLEYGPEEVTDGYYCHCNNLKSLKGVAKIIGDEFVCSAQRTPLAFNKKYLPKEVRGNFRHKIVFNKKPISQSTLRKYVNIGGYIRYEDN